MTRTLNVLMTADAIGGVYSFSLSLSRVLCGVGARIHLATMGPPPSADQVKDARAIAGLTLHVSDFALEWMEDPWEDVDRAGEWLLRLEAEVGPDVVHLNGYAHGALPFGAPVVCVGHSSVCSWWRAVHGEEAPPAWNRYREAVQAGLAGASAVVSPTAWMLAELERSYGPFSRAAVIPNGVDARPIRRRRKEPFFLASGRIWDPAKNMSLLDRAARELRWPVFAAGSANAPSGERAQLESVKLLGAMSSSRMAEWMARAPILIHPALYEPFGLVPLEAAAAGAALLLADIPSLREIWGDAAAYFSPRDPAELGWLAQSLAVDTELRLELARRARSRAHRYPIENTGARYLELYRRVLTQERPEVQRS